ncbi:hypothetical protein WJX73_007647 [Symbiochloris irregularis]|uniref:Programmed cell death protein 2 C-terminal domain-containing protein n=1 Tax=Symbiochloris irregularis TaxID=706552 RepID=A0AAW1NWM3_9CHLO
MSSAYIKPGESVAPTPLLASDPGLDNQSTMSQHSDDEQDVDEQWMLGFAEPADAHDLLRHRFRSKVGGRPAWLNPEQLPSSALLRCSVSGQPLHFLLQVYAPIDDAPPSAFHRFIFVFISAAGNKLSQPGAVKAFRCQLPRHNPFYSSDPDPAELPKQVQQPPKSDPWNVAEAEAALREGQSPPGLQGMHLYPEYELVVEPEEASLDDLGAAMQHHSVGNGDEGEALDDVSASVMDSVEAQATPAQQQYARFAAKIASAPEQVIRYRFAREVKPLCPGTTSPPGPGAIPACPHCHSARQFEFQVMPQMIHYLGVDADAATSPDWGTIAVYSCPRSCATSEAYTEEHVWVQPPDS